MRIDIEADVISKDGHRVGKVDRVVLIPSTLKVTHIVIRKGLFLTRDIVVPVEAVDRLTERQVHLRITGAELERMPDFLEEEFVTPPHSAPVGPYVPGSVLWPSAYVYAPAIMREERNIPEEAVDLNEGTDVHCLDGKIGVVDELVVDPVTGRVTAFIVRQGGLIAHDVTVPVSWVKRADRDIVELVCSKGDIQKLPH